MTIKVSHFHIATRIEIAKPTDGVCDIDLSHLDIEDDDIRFIIVCIKQTPALNSTKINLDLSHNNLIGYGLFTSLQSLANIPIYSLNLSHNKICEFFLNKETMSKRLAKSNIKCLILNNNLVEFSLESFAVHTNQIYLELDGIQNAPLEVQSRLNQRIENNRKNMDKEARRQLRDLEFREKLKSGYTLKTPSKKNLKWSICGYTSLLFDWFSTCNGVRPRTERSADPEHAERQSPTCP